MAKTLYLSDLDGTLLTSAQRTSAFTNETVARLVRAGMLFSYATARSVETASVAAAGLEVSAPVIVHNGAVIADAKTHARIAAERFSAAEAEEIFSAFARRGLYPLVYAVIGGKNRFSYCARLCGRAQTAFLRTRLGDERARAAEDPRALLDGEVFYFSCIDDAAKLFPAFEELRKKFRCFYAKDIYSGEQWLEILPARADKASAALKLKKLLGAERIVCFGDEANDIPLFEVADEGYAVKNAAPELKRRAAGIVGGNDEDGVARWLAEHFCP